MSGSPVANCRGTRTYSTLTTATVPVGNTEPQSSRFIDDRVLVHGPMVVSVGSREEGHRLPVAACHRAHGVVVDRTRPGGPRMNVPLADVSEGVVGRGAIEVRPAVEPGTWTMSSTTTLSPGSRSGCRPRSTWRAARAAAANASRALR